MPSAVETKRDKLEAREANILASARDVFMQHGYHGAKMTLIAKKSGVAEGTIYLYYKNKNAIVSAVLKEHWDALTLGASKVIASQEDSFEKLEAFADYHLARLVSDWRIVELGYVQHYSANVGYEDTLNFIRSYAVLLDDIIEQGVDRRVFNSGADKLFLRDLFFGTMEYAARSLLMREDEDSLPSVVVNLMTTLRGLLAPMPSMKSGQETTLSKLTQQLGEITHQLEALSP